MLNQQKPEPAIRGHDGERLDIIEIFPTIQGEGPFTGRACVFIRLAGCNLQCPWCDTQYTEGRRSLLRDDVVTAALEMMPQRAKLVVITGGEPLRQNIAPMISELVTNGIEVQIESNGVFAPSPALRLLLMTPMVHLVVSPKTSNINYYAAEYATAFKYVVEDGHQDEHDGLPTVALGHKAAPRVARPPASYKGPIYVNPMDAKDPQANSNNVAAAVSAAMRHGYILGLQVHKIIDMP